uniref:Uncharacterized protein n=1 Tax=Pectobacterium phage Koroua TaxID=3158138 RepID=A0AB39ABN9_9CAUD
MLKRGTVFLNPTGKHCVATGMIFNSNFSDPEGDYLFCEVNYRVLGSDVESFICGDMRTEIEKIDVMGNEEFLNLARKINMGCQYV